MVDVALTAFVRASVRSAKYDHDMHDLYISSRRALHDAIDLVDEYGPDAPVAAAQLASQSRDVGNVNGFCHWRQLERVTALLASNHVVGTIH